MPEPPAPGPVPDAAAPAVEALPVPVYVTYLTAVPDGTSIAYLDDIYGRDSARIAQLRGSSLAAAGQ